VRASTRARSRFGRAGSCSRSGRRAWRGSTVHPGFWRPDPRSRLRSGAEGDSRSARGRKFSRCFHSGVKTCARTPTETMRAGVFTVNTQGTRSFHSTRKRKSSLKTSHTREGTAGLPPPLAGHSRHTITPASSRKLAQHARSRDATRRWRRRSRTGVGMTAVGPARFDDCPPVRGPAFSQ